MSASDALGVQFVPTREVAGMYSGDYGGQVGDAPAKYLAPGGKREQDGVTRMNAVRQSVRAKGIKQPLEVTRWSGGVHELTNGHHRAMIAMEQGITHVPVRFTSRG